MSNIVQVKQLWVDGAFLPCGDWVALRCDSISADGLRPGWLVPTGNCGSGGYDLALTLPVPLPLGTLLGVWFSQGNGGGMVIDAAGISDILTACAQCCDGALPPPNLDVEPLALSAAAIQVPPKYNGIFPAVIFPVPVIYRFKRTDTGNSYSYNRVSEQYYGQYLPSSFRQVARDGDDSIYEMAAFNPPALLAGDSAVPLTPNTYTSNTAPVLSAGEQLTFNAVVNSSGISPVLVGATVAALVAQIPSKPPYTIWGTWAVVSNAITLTSSNVFSAILTIDKQPIPSNTFFSNSAPTLGVGQQFTFTATINGIPVTPMLTGVTLVLVVTAANGNPNYNTQGTWAVVGNKISLSSITVTNANLVIGIQDIPDQNFQSNDAPALSPGNVYTFTVVADGINVTPVIQGFSVPLLLDQIGLQSTYTTRGSWSQVGSKIQLSSTDVGSATLVIGLIGQPALRLESNVAPALSGGQTYILEGNVEGIVLPPSMTAATLPELVGLLSANNIFSVYGLWNVSAGKIQLYNSTPRTGSLTVRAIPQVFISNAAPVLDAGEEYTFTLDAGSGTVLPVLTGQSLVDVAASANATGSYFLFGTFNVVGNTITLTTNAPITATLVIAKQPIP